MKKIISLLLSLVLLFGIGAETFAAVSEARTETSYVTVDCTNKVDISYEITNRQSNSFTVEISITNKSDEPISGWQLSFKGNFGISSVQNANNLRSENEFRIENNASDQPIAKGETKKFEFQGVIAPGETPVLSDFVLTSVVPNSDNAQTRMIMCFGEYLEEEKSLEIYWFSTDEGAVSLYENTDNGGWEKLAELTDEKSYKHKINGDFLEKQIKAVQKTVDGTLESEPFIVAHKDGKIVCEWLDSDDDGIADFAEKTLGTDPEKPDTDGDGLTDYEEFYITGTNSLKSDTNGNGVNDADDDSDGDGLSNREEISLGTSPISADTDEDGLSDSEEINKHKTDPLKADSDGDGLNDGEEIAIGLDPNRPETFGMPDSEYRVTQKISADSEAMSKINTEESPYELSLEISATGNASTRLSANDSSYSAVTESDARLGGAVELRYLGEVDKVKLTYKIADEYIPNSDEISGKSLDLQGIKRYNIFRYFEEINMLLPVETKFDEESNTLSAETDELGTYCVLDMEVLMSNLGIEPEGVSTETVTQQMYSGAPAATNDSTVNNLDELYNIIFIIDERSSVISTEQFNTIKKQILEFANTLVAQQKDFKITIYKQSSTNFVKYCPKLTGVFNPGDYNYKSVGRLSEFIGGVTGDVSPMWKNCIISEGLSSALGNCDNSTHNYIFDIYAQEDSVYDAQSVSGILNEAAEYNVNISIISDSMSLTGFQSEIANKTNGLILDYNNSFVGKIYKHIFNEEYVKQEISQYEYGSEFEAILANGLQRVVLKSELYPNGENPSGEDTDTDMDGLSDWDEVNFAHWEELGLITYDEKHNAILPTIKQCMEFVEKPYIYNGFSGFKSRFYRGGPANLPINDVDDMFEAKLCSTRIMPVSTDPTDKDTDGDGLYDSYDPVPQSTYNNGKNMELASGEIEKLQKWLVYLGYLDMKGNPYGKSYGILTSTAVNVYQLNHGFKLSDVIDTNTYATIANEYMLKSGLGIDAYNNIPNVSKPYFKQIPITKPLLSKEYIDAGVDIILADNSKIKSEKDFDNNPVAVIPLYLYDYTIPINKMLNKNADICFKHSPPDELSYLWFFLMVKSGAPWDIKLQKRWSEQLPDIKQYSKHFPFNFRNVVITAEDLGNIAYGYWGTCVGFDFKILLLGAAIAAGGTDSQEDTDAIKAGNFCYCVDFDDFSMSFIYSIGVM